MHAARHHSLTVKKAGVVASLPTAIVPTAQLSNPAPARAPSYSAFVASQQMASTTTNSFAALEGVGEIEDVTASTAAAPDAAGTSSGDGEPCDSNASTRSGKWKKQLRSPLIWIDLEMTGLDIDKDTIIEIACIATDGNVSVHVQGPCIAIHHSDEVLDNMNDWCKEHHGKSGLTQRVRDSTVSMAQAEEQVLAFIQQHAEEGMAQLAGNSIHVDRMFMNKYMPQVVAYLNYRIVDVSSVKELARRWYPNAYKKAPRKALAHTALSDIKESIAELLYYRKQIFKDPRQVK